MKKSLLSSFFLSVAILALPIIIFAESVDTSYPMPAKDMFSTAEYETLFTRWQSVPFNDHQLAYEIMTPKEWASPNIEVPKEDSSRKFITIGAFFLTGHPSAMIQVSYMASPFGVSVDNFLRIYCSENNMRIIKMLRVDYVTREAAEALVERQNGDGRIISRLSFSKDGNRIFFVACSASAEDYGLLYKIFAAACASFKLTNPAGLG